MSFFNRMPVRKSEPVTVTKGWDNLHAAQAKGASGAAKESTEMAGLHTAAAAATAGAGNEKTAAFHSKAADMHTEAATHYTKASNAYDNGNTAKGAEHMSNAAGASCKASDYEQNFGKTSKADVPVKKEYVESLVQKDWKKWNDEHRAGSLVKEKGSKDGVTYKVVKPAVHGNSKEAKNTGNMNKGGFVTVATTDNHPRYKPGVEIGIHHSQLESA